VSKLFNADDRESIRQAIASAEMMTSGEIRVFFEPSCEGEPYQRALEVFANLKMHQTALHNGVLFYLASDDHKFALVGDEGIHLKVGPQFWEDVKEKCIGDFKEGRYVRGLQQAIAEVGNQLKQWFPRDTNDKNELPDDVIIND
jgi:uncharacterized membrane protein